MTFSILARCAESGRMGLAVTSSSLAVGARCAFARGRVGVVATQNRTDPTIGPRLLAALAGGGSVEAALEEVIAATTHPAWRQVGVIDAQGRIASYHGSRCSGLHAEARGEGRGEGSLALGNILADTGVPAAVVAGFAASAGPLEARLIAALQAGAAAGGEVKALASAALVTVGEESFPYSDLRIDRSTQPLEDLEALWRDWQPLAETCRTWALDPGAV